MATSPTLDLRTLAEAARQKGITLLAAPDFTHPAWREEMRSELELVADGIYSAHGANFILVTEISCIWRQDDRSRRVHLLLMVPGMETADCVSESLSAYQDLESDGRPMIKLSAAELYRLALDADPKCVIIPAHVWTPWYGVYGSKSGFDSLEECFGDMSQHVPAIETGLSSDPAMNWAVPDVAGRAIVSFSDAHSPGTMGREVTVLDAGLDYATIRSALFENRVVETVEFHPEHGKYHLNGHRKCLIRLTPEETPPDGRCPVCRRMLTLGVLERVQQLSADQVDARLGKDGLIRGPAGRAPFRSLVPLRELLAQALGTGVNSRRVMAVYSAMVQELGGELNVLTAASESDLGRVANAKVAACVTAVRSGEVEIEAGYDGVYGKVTAALRDNQ